MGKNRIKAFDGPGPGENPHGYRQVGPNGVGRGGIGDQGDEGQQWQWGPNVAGAPWAPPEPELMPLHSIRTVRRK